MRVSVWFRRSVYSV